MNTGRCLTTGEGRREGLAALVGLPDVGFGCLDFGTCVGDVNE